MNLRKVSDDYSIAEQIHERHLPDLAGDGYTDVVCNRPDHEDPEQPAFADLSAAAERHGLNFHHIPIDASGIDSLHEEKLSVVLAAAEGKVLAFCKSGMRSLMLYQRVGKSRERT